MTVVRVDVGRNGVLDVCPSLPSRLAALPPGAPIVVMMHGYRYSPRHRRECPHESLFAPARRCDRVPSWPEALDLPGAGGLAIGLGWHARGSLHGAYRRAGTAGAALARLVAQLRQGSPTARISLLGHSLGARVALAALPDLAAGAVDTVILLAAAEFRYLAERAADSRAGACAQILNVTSRENDLFDLGVQLILSGGRSGTLGRGLRTPRPNWVDLPIHDPATLATLAALGHPVAPPAAWVCHWSGYTRPGVLPLYRAVIDGSLAPDHLRAPQAPRPTRRWTRLLAPIRDKMPLPLPGKASS